MGAGASGRPGAAGLVDRQAPGSPALVEARLRRGRVLRELLKQDRRAPLPIEYQLAWLTAFNEGILDGKLPEEIPDLKKRLAAATAAGRLHVGKRL
ncbi:MAG: hypothetical protein WBX49_10395 [Candidatus Deferrimicrobiaceae bacterium]